MAKLYKTPFNTGTKTQTRILHKGRWLRITDALPIARRIVLGMGQNAGKSSRENIARVL